LVIATGEERWKQAGKVGVYMGRGAGLAHGIWSLFFFPFRDF
jgi:hypothetical protein